jgi:16S rRNA pseudouridine516 synthase
MEKNVMMEKMQRLDKALANSGYGSRTEIKLLIKKGLVAVDGIIVRDSGMQVNPDKSDIRIENKSIQYKKFIYIMMNKPAGVISATFDKKLKTVLDIIPEEFKKFDVFPVGRLDIDTEGLLLLTNDGQFAHDILSPKKHIPKTYYAKVKGVVGQSDIDIFKERVVLEDGFQCLPAELVILKASDISKIQLTIYEGKFHQVKRMFQAVGKEVVYLKRISMGRLNLDDSIMIGESRELREEEMRRIKPN